jgi:hypothetical protein
MLRGGGIAGKENGILALHLQSISILKKSFGVLNTAIHHVLRAYQIDH